MALVMEREMATPYNAKVILANKIPPDKQWWVIESILKRAEEFGETPQFKQRNDEQADSIVIYFRMNEEQRRDFLITFSQQKKS